MNLDKNQLQKPQADERGFASIVIALILILILSLLTIGFAQLARREQQTALDKQLANQAQYAAESGINDAYYDITHNDPAHVSLAYPSGYPYIFDNTPTGGATNASSTTCMTPLSINNANAKSSHQQLDAPTGVSYSCLLVDLQPPDIQYDGVAAQSSRYLTFFTDTAPASFTVFWNSADGKSANNSQFPVDTSGGFKPAASWSHAAVLQVSLTPLSLGSSRASLTNNTFTVYLYPAAGGANVIGYASSNSASEGAVVSGHCDTTNGNYPCQSKIVFPPLLPVGTGPYLIHINDYYDTSNISINGTNSLGKPIHFIDGQAVIDATGRAKYVLKRLRVHIPIHPNAAVPTDAIDGLNVCKRFGTYPGSVTTDTLPGCSLDD